MQLKEDKLSFKWKSKKTSYRISTFFCGNFISAISAVYNDTADLKTAEN
jgi:hypothetical protein